MLSEKSIISVRKNVLPPAHAYEILRFSHKISALDLIQNICSVSHGHLEGGRK